MAEKSSVPYDTLSGTTVSTKSIFTKCCFCVPLRLGCLILGYIHLILNVLQTIVFLGSLITMGILSHGFEHFELLIPSPNEDDTSGMNLEITFLKTFGITLFVLIIINTIWLIMNIVCLVGLHKKRPGPIRVYVGFATARVILGLAFFIYSIIINFNVSNLVFGFDIGLSTYFIFIYHIYAVRLEKERQAAAVQSTPTSDVIVSPTKIDKDHLVA